MRRLVVDTGIYVDWINVGRHEEVLFERGSVKYMSAVVLMELRAGAFSAPDLRRLRNIETSFKKAGRVLVPTALAYTEAGDVLRVLQSERGYNIKGGHSIVNDVLIALSARSIGATVVTQNARDFRAIQAIRQFQLRWIAAS